MAYPADVDTPHFSWSLSHPDETPTVALVGELDLAGVPDLRSQLAALVAEGGRVTIDLSELSFIDSTGLGLMLGTQRTAAETGCEVVFRRPQPAVRRLLEITGTDGFFTFTD
jgi:anti-sigma B factor antagonist